MNTEAKMLAEVLPSTLVINFANAKNASNMVCLHEKAIVNPRVTMIKSFN